MDVKRQIRSKLLAGSEVGVIDPETLHFVESELVEDYLEGTLTSSESDLFNRNYLVNDERKELLNEIRMLKRFSSDAHEFDASIFDGLDDKAPEPARSSVWPALIVAAIVIILLIAAWRLL